MEDVAVQLPPKHCAFKDCAWIGDSEEERLSHLEDAHALDLDRVASLLPGCVPLEHRRMAAYSEAISTAVRKGAPTASYSIDRRCLHNYASATRGEAVQALICFFCGCVYPRIEARRVNEIRWVHPFDGKSRLCGVDRQKAMNLFGLNEFLERYGRCDDGVPDLTKHLEEFEDWQWEQAKWPSSLQGLCKACMKNGNANFLTTINMQGRTNSSKKK